MQSSFVAQSEKDGGLSRVGEQCEISGWVRTLRSQKSFSFVEVMSGYRMICRLYDSVSLQISDGSTLSTLQVILQDDVTGYDLVKEGNIHTGAAITVTGKLVESPGGKQKVQQSTPYIFD